MLFPIYNKTYTSYNVERETKYFKSTPICLCNKFKRAMLSLCSIHPNPLWLNALSTFFACQVS